MPILLRGAMRVPCSMPGRVGRWPTLAFGVLGAGNTCLFRDSASTSASSMRLFFERFLRARNYALSDNKTGIAVGMIAHPARLAQHEGSARGIASFRLTGSIAADQTMAAVTLPGCI